MSFKKTDENLKEKYNRILIEIFKLNILLEIVLYYFENHLSVFKRYILTSSWIGHKDFQNIPQCGRIKNV